MSPPPASVPSSGAPAEAGRLTTLKADATRLCVEPDERDLREVHGDGRVGGVKLMPAIAAAVGERAAQCVVVGLRDAQAHAAAAHEADLDAPVVGLGHQ